MPSFTWPERTSSTVIFTESPIRMFSPNFLVRTSIVEATSAPGVSTAARVKHRIGQWRERLDDRIAPETLRHQVSTPSPRLPIRSQTLPMRMLDSTESAASLVEPHCSEAPHGGPNRFD